MFALKTLVCVVLLTCLEHSSAFKIFNGREVSKGKYPWMGWVLEGNRKVKCGAALIAKKYALTAASCVGDTITTVIFGDHSRSTDEGTEQEATVKSVSQHPDYIPGSFEYDIAVIEFQEELSTRKRDDVAPIQMLSDDKLTEKIMNKRCRAAGWGFEVSGESGRARDQSDVLLDIVADVNDTCTESPNGTVCFSPFRDPTSLTCAGDVGGPFMCKRRGVWTLVGVISGWRVGTGCVPGNRAFLPLIFIGISAWIADIIENPVDKTVFNSF